MADLNAVMDSLDDLSDDLKGLYTEKEGKFVLTGIQGVVQKSDYDGLRVGLDKERADHRKTKESLGVWGDLDYKDTMSKLDRIPELELAAQGKTDDFDTKLEELAGARVKTAVAPLERDKESLTKQNQELLDKVAAYEAADLKRSITDAIRGVATEQKIIPSAMADVELLAQAVFQRTEEGIFLTKENPFGISPGLDPVGFFAEMQPKREHWWPKSEGGGASGSGSGGGFSNNPFSAEHWNLTEQGKAIAANRQQAERMAAAAGTKIGAPKPQPAKS